MSYHFDKLQDKISDRKLAFAISDDVGDNIFHSFLPEWKMVN
jgi:hypothetical protein